MNAEFSRTLSLLRQEKGVSQRTAAGVLGISQALLSHYENGIREPGLTFVVKACDYYGVSADYLLGRTLTRDGTTIGTEELYDISDEKDNSMRGSVLALLSKKLLVNSVGMLFDLLGKTGSREAIRAASNYLSTALYNLPAALYGRSGRRRHAPERGGALRRPGRPRQGQGEDARDGPRRPGPGLPRFVPVHAPAHPQLRGADQPELCRPGGAGEEIVFFLPLLEVFAGDFAACGRRVPLPMAAKEPKRPRGRLQMSTSCS